LSSVFISYNHQDKIVDDIVSLFKENDILVWFDKSNLKVSENWKRHIENAIRSSSCLVAFYSKNYDASNRCRTELDIANKIGKEIYMIALDDSLDSFSLDESYKNIQRPFIDKSQISAKYIFDVLMNNELFPKIYQSKLSVDYKYDMNGTHVVFNQFIEDLKNKNHYVMCDLIINFINYIQEKESQGLYVSDSANLLSIHAIVNNESSYFALVNENDFTNNKTNNSLKIAKTLFWHLFFNGYSSVEYDENLSFDKIYTSCVQYELINKKISLGYKETSLAKIKYHLFQASKASRYYETIKQGLKANDVELSELILSICKETYLEKNTDILNSYDYHMAPSIFDGTDVISAKEECQNPLVSKLLDKNDRNDVIIYGQPGSGKSRLVINTLNNLDNILYLDLLKVTNLKENLIKELIDSSSSFGYNIKFESLCNYSLLRRPVTLIVENIDYIDEAQKSSVIDEINSYDEIFRFVISSNKRNLDGKISLTSKNGLNVNYLYYEILKPSRENLLTYLKYNLSKTHPIVDFVNNLDNDNDFFTFYDSYDKAKILVDSIKKISESKFDELINENNNAFELYNKIFNGNEEYSIVKTINEFFSDEYADLSDLISAEMEKEIKALKQISYDNDMEKLNTLRFKKLDSEYSILSETVSGSYSFFSDEIKSFFKASYINDSIRKNKDLTKEFLLSVSNEANTLKYLNYYQIVEYLTNDFQNIPVDDNLQIVLFKISQYNINNASRFVDEATFKEVPDNCFKNFENVERVIVPRSVIVIGRAAFCNMPRLKEVYIESTSMKFDIKAWAFINCPNLEVIHFDSIYNNYNFPLYFNCKGIKKIEINNPDSKLGTLLDGRMITSSDHKILYNVTNNFKDTLVIPDEIEIIDTNSCSFLTDVKSIVIGKNVKEVDSSFSDFCDSLIKFEVIDNPNYYTDDLGIMYNDEDNKKILFRAPSAMEGKLIIPDDVNVIGPDSVSTCTKLTEIVVPASVSEFAGYAFADTFSLERLIIKGKIKDSKYYVFLNANPNLKIEEHNYGSSRPISLQQFIKYNSKYEQKTLEFKETDNIDFLFGDIYEKCQEGTLRNKVSKVRMFRSMELDNETSKGEVDEYNILIIGQTEYNMINGNQESKIKDLISKMIERFQIKAVIYTRDLPYIPQFFDFSDLKIVRTDLGSSKVSNMIYQNVLKEA